MSYAEASKGLSPPTRGILLFHNFADDFVGSIPAYAGDPHQPPMCILRYKVYPRLRGGSTDSDTGSGVGEGLSPPTRGIRRRIAHERIANRSIPAYAGDP